MPCCHPGSGVPGGNSPTVEPSRLLLEEQSKGEFRLRVLCLRCSPLSPGKLEKTMITAFRSSLVDCYRQLGCCSRLCLLCPSFLPGISWLAWLAWQVRRVLFSLTACQLKLGKQPTLKRLTAAKVFVGVPLLQVLAHAVVMSFFSETSLRHLENLLRRDVLEICKLERDQTTALSTA